MAALDKLRDKWESITPRERRMVIVLGLSTLVILIAYVSLQIRDGINALERKNADARRALANLATSKAQAGKDTPDDPSKQIDVEPIKLESYIFRAADKAQVRDKVPGVNTRTPTPKGKFIAHAATVELRELTLTQVKDFLEAIEGESKLVVVSSLHLRRNFRDKEKLDLNLEIVTWACAPDSGVGKCAAGKAKKG